MYIQTCESLGQVPTDSGTGSLADDLRRHIRQNGSLDVERRIEQERQRLGRTLVIIAENHQANTRTAELARRLMGNDVYKFIASEHFFNAGSYRNVIREFIRGSLTTLNCGVDEQRLLRPYENLLRYLISRRRYILFVGSRRNGINVRDQRIALHFVEEMADRGLNRTTSGIFVCGAGHGSRVARVGQRRTARQRLEDAGFRILGVRLLTDDIDRASSRVNGIQIRTDMVWPIGEMRTEANVIRLLDLVPTTSEYTVVSTRNSPFQRITDDPAGDSSSVSMAERYELVVFARSMQHPCP